LLFLHGFPSTSYEWRHQLKFFIERGYGVLAPDLLGSGNTSKPLDVNSYVGRSMASSIISILDHEKLCVPGKEVIAIAHDWGTYLLSQLIVWHDDRFTKYVFFSVPHTLPGRRTDLEAFNKVMKEKKGYEIYGYQFFLAEVERAGTVLGKNVSLIT
jgi:soluble epoxide hydrolase/lipid-phosphate phosphatase